MSITDNLSFGYSLLIVMGEAEITLGNFFLNFLKTYLVAFFKIVFPFSEFSKRK